MEALVRGCWMCLTPSFSSQKNQTSCVGCCLRDVQCGAQAPGESFTSFATKQNIRHILQLEKKIQFVTGISRTETVALMEGNLSALELALALDRFLCNIMDQIDHLVYQRTTDMPPRMLFRRASWSCPPTRAHNDYIQDGEDTQQDS